MAHRAWPEFLIVDGTENEGPQLCIKTSPSSQSHSHNSTNKKPKHLSYFSLRSTTVISIAAYIPTHKSLVLFQYFFFPCLRLHKIEFGINSSQIIQKSFLLGI